MRDLDREVPGGGGRRHPFGSLCTSGSGRKQGAEYHDLAAHQPRPYPGPSDSEQRKRVSMEPCNGHLGCGDDERATVQLHLEGGGKTKTGQRQEMCTTYAYGPNPCEEVVSDGALSPAP